MSVKAQWFARAEVSEEIPCAQQDPDSIEAMTSELHALMEAEATLFNCGITCPIRDCPDSVCSVCPLSKHAERLDPLQPLCTIGRKIDRLLTRIAISRSRGCVS